MPDATVHVIGAGLAGLAAAVRLVRGGWSVRVHEATGHAGGRCRSFHDDRLGCVIDNGNHLMLSGNRSVMAYLDEIGARNALTGPDSPRFPFLDLDNGERWTLDMGNSALPGWIFKPERRVPGTGYMDYIPGLGLMFAGPQRTVADVVGTDGPIWRRFWEPLTIAALNIDPREAQALLLGAVLRETFLKGGQACRPMIARDGLGPALVEPARAFLEANNAPVSCNRRLRALGIEGTRVSALAFGDEDIPLGPRDHVVLAVPPMRAREIVPGLDAPDETGVIVNAHFALDRPAPVPDGAPFIGLLGAVAQWIFVRGHVISITISAAAAEARRDQDDLIAALWRETQLALGLEGVDYRAARIIREKRATFDQSPAGAQHRAAPTGRFDNLVLAGDWTATGLPATIEGAVRSGHRAALAISRTAAR